MDYKGEELEADLVGTAKSMSEMTSRKRLMKAYRLEEPDRVPITFYSTEEWVKSGDNSTVNLVMNESDITFLIDIAGMDGCRMYFGDIPIKSERYSQEGYDYIRYTVETPKGPLQSLVKIYPEHFGGEWKIEHFAKDEQDVERFLSIPYKPFKPNPKSYLKWKRRIGERGVVNLAIPAPIYLAAFLMRLDTFLFNCIRNPSLIFQIEGVALQRLLDYINYLSKVGVDIYWMIGAEFLSTTMAHPRNYEKYVLPYDQKVVKAIHDANGIAYTHMHGKVGTLLEKIAATGIDVLDPLEPPPRGDVDLKYAKKTIGSKVCLCGNIDQINLPVQNPKQIVDMCRKSIEAAAHEGGYVVMTTGTLGEVRPSIPVENLKALIDAVKRYGKYS